MPAQLAEGVVNNTGEGGCCSRSFFYGPSEALVKGGKPSRNPTIGIDQVEVGFTRVLEEEDQQTTEWIRAELAPSESDETWVQWRLEWEGPVGDWFIQCRATDKMGITQGPERVPARPNGAEGFHTIAARVV